MTLAAPFEMVLQKQGGDCKAKVCVAVSCFKYGREAIEAFASVLTQTEPLLDLVTVDDCSPDDSVVVIEAWLKQNIESPKLANVSFVRHHCCPS